MLSYWEKESFISYDYIIVGGGIVGFSTAISLKEKYPKSSVLVLEAGFLPSGASTKNAGFACVGSLSEIVEDLKTHSVAEIQDLTRLRWQGLKLLKSRLGEKSIQYEACGSNELLFAHETHLLEQVSRVNTILEPIFNQAIFEENKTDLKGTGFGTSVKIWIQNKVEGSIHTGKMMKTLILKAQALGVEYKTLAKVNNIQEEVSLVAVFIENFQTSLRAKKVFICTNAFAKQFLPEIDLKPGRGQILVTKEIPNLKFKGIFHFDGGYYYFREINRRVLFGGGRHIDFDAETTVEFELNAKIQEDLEAKLRTIICPTTSFEIEQRWSGIMAFGQSKTPLIKQVSPNVIAGIRLGGMGIAIGSMMGEMLVDKV